MKLLLDTHVFIWWDDDINRLSQIAYNELNDPNNSLYLSAASIWEMQIKMDLGKLAFNLPLR